MKNDTRSSVFNRHGKAYRFSRLSVCIGAVLALNGAWADVGLPPPAQHQGSGFPSEQALKQRGYDPKTGVWRVQTQNQGKPTVTKNGGTITGSQNKSVTVTGKYGEKGVIHTQQTQTVNLSKLQTSANGLIVTNIIGQGLNGSSPYLEQLGRNIKNGNWSGAVHSAIMSGGGFIDGILGGGLGNAARSFGRGIGTLPSEPSPGQLGEIGRQAATAQAQAERQGDLGGALGYAAAKKAAEGAAKAAEGDGAYKEAKEKAAKGERIYQVILSYTDYGIKPVKTRFERLSVYTDYDSWKVGNSYATYDDKGKMTLVRSSPFDEYLPKSFKGAGSALVSTELVFTNTPPPESVKSEDMTLNQNDIKDILERMLNNQQTNHAELMNQLSKIGDAVEKATESNSFTPAEATSAPYTPQGSSVPQQTVFRLNSDGTVTTSTVERPDLKANSSQAPTRSEVVPETAGTTSNSGQNGQSQTQNQEKQDFCQQNPSSAVCMDAGSADYEDLNLPEQTIDLNFKPLDVFQSDGTCPAPRTVDFGALGTVEFAFDPLCDLARKLRPIFIAICILTCSYFVYQSVKEL